MSKKRKILFKKLIQEKKKGGAFFFSHFSSFLILTFVILIGLVSLGIIFIQNAYYYYAKDLPEPTIETQDYPEITRIYDREGRLLFEDVGEEERIYIKVSDVSSQFLKTILASEDQHFFQHSGIDFWANMRILWQYFRYGDSYGGASTITQQLARNFFLNREVTLKRKFQEMILARKIEEKYSKKEILEFYLNKIPFGSNIYGVEAAAQAFFGKSARFLTLAESATLAPVPRAPSYLYPYDNPEELKKRKEELLNRMLKKEIINDKEHEKAIKEEIAFREREKKIAAPHFVFYVLDELKKLYSEETREKGLEVVTTLDLSLQEKIDRLLKQTIDRYKTKYKIDDGAIVVLDAKSANILAMAGSYDFWDEEYGQHNSALALRQPGSTLKPLIYSLAIEDLNWSGKTILEDKPIDFNGYQPKNFSGYFSGRTSLEAALLNSLNVPAVWTLNNIGVDRAFSVLQNCNLELDRGAGLSMAVGGAATNLLDLTSSYTVFVNEGKCLAANFFVRMKDGSDKLLISNPKENADQVFDKDAVSEIDNILKKYLKNFPETKSLASKPYLNGTRVKTGTSNGPRDVWSIGYNSDIIVGVWLGNHDNSLLKYNVYGLKAAVPLWADAFQIVKNHQPADIVFKLD